MIIGAGVLGASTFYQLARAGVSVCLVEKHTPGSGITAYSGGVVRAFHLNREQRQRALYSLAYYRQFSAHVEQEVRFSATGYLYFPSSDEIEQCKTIVSEQDCISEGTCWLNAKALLQRFPFLQAQALQGAVWEPQGGYMDAVGVTQAWIDAGRRFGGDVFQGTNVSSGIFSGNRMTGIATNLGEIHAEQFVIAAGLSSRELLGKFRCSAELHHKTIQVDLYQPQCAEVRMPCYTDAQFDLNGRGGDTGILLGRSCKPFDTHFYADIAQQSDAQTAAQQRYTWPASSVVKGSFCSPDTYSDKALGYADYMDPEQQIVLVSGFNGTAFKFAPFIGEHIKHLITNDSGVDQ